jgi:predicted helicase
MSASPVSRGTCRVHRIAGRRPVQLHYRDIGDYLSRRDKLGIIRATGSIEHLDLTTITPNTAGDWLNQRRDDFERFMPIGSKDERIAVFGLYSGGLKSNRDPWVYNFDRQGAGDNMRLLVDTYNSERVAVQANASHEVTADAARISWNRGLLADLHRGILHGFRDEALTVGTYRPFTREHVYFDRAMNDMVYRLPRLFPSPTVANFGYFLPNPGSMAPVFMCLMTDGLIDNGATGSSGANHFTRWVFEAIEYDDALFDAADGEVIDGYRRIDNITDEALARFHTAYGPSITKDDVFFYVYGLLHCPDYRNQFAADLKKMLPRIPMVTDPHPFIDAGRALSELHLGYESAKPHTLDGLPDGAAVTSDAAYQHFRVEKMRFGKPTVEQKQAGLRDDRSAIVYNDHFTLRGGARGGVSLRARVQIRDRVDHGALPGEDR